MQLTSSGQNAYDQAEIVECLACELVDYVDVHIDPAANTWSFVCPSCTTETTEEWRSA
jgi:predicted RNA-binding Zn-ribbon protein involved in translation (DUF1610 family)